ncbi:MAG: PLP-dependent aminotransferase family protein [Rhodocyclaceae bacterium]
MTMWQPRLAPGVPAYLALADEIARGIASGALRPGDRLPTHRLLADLLGLNVSTVTRGYREAARRRLIDGETGRGTYVLGRAAEAGLFALDKRPLRDMIDLSTNTPPQLARDADLALGLAALSEREAAALLHYHTPGDWLVHRAAVSRWLATRGVVAEGHRIVVCAGAHHAMDTAISLFAGAGEVAAEALSYPGLKSIARHRQLRLAPLAMDADGVTPDAMEAACRALPGRVVVVSPTLQNPTTVTMSLTRREVLVAIARRWDATLIEEDVYGMLPPAAPPPLAALAPERTCYVTGLSKTIAPGLRLGYLVVPPVLVERVADAEHRTSWYVAPLAAALAGRWMNDGTAQRRLATQRAELAARHAVVHAQLAGLDWVGAPHCPHVWVATPYAASALAERALRAGVAVVADEVFAVGRMTGPGGLRVSTGAAASRSQLAEGLAVLASLLRT